MIDASSLDDRRAYRRRVIAAVSIGNALEWFDFVAYGFLAVRWRNCSSDIGSVYITAADLRHIRIRFWSGRWALSWWVPMPITEAARRRSC